MLYIDIMVLLDSIQLLYIVLLRCYTFAIHKLRKVVVMAQINIRVNDDELVRLDKLRGSEKMGSYLKRRGLEGGLSKKLDKLLEIVSSPSYVEDFKVVEAGPIEYDVPVKYSSDSSGDLPDVFKTESDVLAESVGYSEVQEWVLERLEAVYGGGGYQQDRDDESKLNRKIKEAGWSFNYGKKQLWRPESESEKAKLIKEY